MLQRTPVTRLRSCSWCGQEFESERRVTACSLECRRARVAHRKDSSFSKSERIAILERDGWRCGICGDAISDECQWPHPMSASVDHIVPVMRGGRRSMLNAQAAHLTCNRAKWTS